MAQGARSLPGARGRLLSRTNRGVDSVLIHLSVIYVTDRLPPQALGGPIEEVFTPREAPISLQPFAANENIYPAKAMLHTRRCSLTRKS